MHKGGKFFFPFLLGLSESPRKLQFVDFVPSVGIGSDRFRQMSSPRDVEKFPQIPQKQMPETIEKGIGAFKKRMESVELENVTAEGLRIDRAHQGSVHSSFIIPPSVSDADGNWEAGAIATVIDMVASVAIYSETGTARGQVTMEYSISYYSSAKIQETVEIEAKVIGKRGKLTSVVVEVRRKEDGALIAVGKMWTASNEFRAPWSQPSKL